jgi:hypothetical protein
MATWCLLSLFLNPHPAPQLSLCSILALQREIAETAWVHVVREVDAVRVPHYTVGCEVIRIRSNDCRTAPMDFVDLSSAVPVKVCVRVLGMWEEGGGAFFHS